MGFNPVEIVEIETRFRLPAFSHLDKVIQALDGQLVREVEGRDFYWDWEKSIVSGVWQRIRDHNVRENGLVEHYQVSQVKSRMSSPPNPYGIEYWSESKPIPVDACKEVEALNSQGYSPLIVEVSRRSYRVPFGRGSVDVNSDKSLFPSGFYLEVGVDVNGLHSRKQTIELVSEFIYQRVLPVFRHIGIDAQAAPTYQEILSNGR